MFMNDSSSWSAEPDSAGRVLALNLHPWLIGQPFRIGYLDEALGHMMRRQGVWTATGTEIINWYKSSYSGG